MKVKKWIHYGDTDLLTDSGIGGMGGFFDDGMRWPDYVEIYTDPGKEYAEALRAEIIEKRIRMTGEDHQNSEVGVPVFDDDTYATFSYRAWGDLMAGIWSTQEDKDYNYMSFYM